ncbi:MAG TPA: HAMP domain-containing sensor histidine kinase [Methylocella sp.]|nr:HAMP domain-containing sensor histidine kinase [Methylocella sp.]
MPARELLKTPTFRLAILVSLAMTASAVVVFVFVYWQVSSFNVNRLNRILTMEAARAVNHSDEQLRDEFELRLLEDLRHLDFAALFDPEGRLRYGNLPAIPNNLPIDGEAHTIEVRSSSGPYPGNDIEIFVARRRQDGSVVLLGRSVYEVHPLTEGLIEAILIGILPAMIFALGAGALFGLHSRRRLKRIHETILRIMHGDLQERLPAAGKLDDLNYVVSAVNLMLDEIVQLLVQIKSVSDNIAHDLRAPLVIVRTRLENGLAAKDDGRLRIAARESLADLNRALAVAAAILRIAEIKTERRRSEFTQVDFVEVCATIFELYEPLAELKNIALTFNASSPVPVIGDFDLLVELVGNLVDNSIKFTPSGGSVRMTAETSDAGFMVCVSDDGPGIAPDERNKIFKRFYRSRNFHDLPGVGIGLNLVATIAEVHEFNVQVEDNNPGAAFKITPRRTV